VKARRLLRVHGRTFWWAAWWLPSEVRARLTRLYALCRTLDDWVDLAPADDAKRQLDAFHAALAGGPIPEALRDLADAALLARHRENLSELCAGFARDLQAPVRIANEAELLAYAEHVAGSVGEMLARELGAPLERARAPARALGVALQLTNIARDVHSDARADRLYLPAEWLPADLDVKRILRATPRTAGSLRDPTERVLSLAARHAQQGLAGLDLLAPRVRRAMAIAARLYLAIGDEVRRELIAGRCDRRAVVPLQRKLALTLAIWRER
jgi:15-cis-phytoene synthase